MSLHDQDRNVVGCYRISPIDLKPEGKPMNIQRCRSVWTLGAVLITALAGDAGAAMQQSPKDEVASVVGAFHVALAAGDSVAALTHLADDVVILEGGAVEDKEHYRSGHLAGDMRFAQAVPRERSEIEVRLIGDVAWAHSTSITQGQMGDREINSQGAELAVLTREGGTWRIKAIHWSSRQRR